jgi:CubicO group peptidase (beta-lactamase class C family)
MKIPFAPKLVTTSPPDEVTRIAEEEHPSSVGLSHDAVQEMWRAVVRLYQTGLHPAIALCVRKNGRVIIDRSIGHSRGNAPGEAGTEKVIATPKTLFNLFSASKAITAMLIHLLDEKRLLHLDDPVAEYIPEFAQNGKDWVTIRHVLTHRAGIPTLPSEHIDPNLLTEPKRIVTLLCQSKPTSKPGRRLAYHALTGGYILGELIERVTGKDPRRFLQDEVLAPLGIEQLNYGVTEEEIPQVAQNAITGPPALPPYSWLLEKALGVNLETAVLLSNDARFLTSIIPAGNIIGTANQTSLFFELLLQGGSLNNKKIFDRRTIRHAIAEQVYLEVDSILRVPVRYGMGFMLGAKWLSLYGHSTEQAFGHVGFTTTIAWADPERNISVALMTSGKPFVTLRQIPWLLVARTIARCTQ